MKHLCDSNVFLALAIGQHAHHSSALNWFNRLVAMDTALFCRATRISFLRLLTQKIAPNFVPLSNRDAWIVLDQLTQDESISFEAEPAEVDQIWRQLSESATASPKMWMDAYLAAFSIARGLRLVTFDKDFRKFEANGLDLLLLS